MKKTTLIVGLMVVLLAGCDNKPATSLMPEVNDRNCQLAAIKKIEERAIREKFAGLCSRRSPASSGIAPTEKPMNWLELADPKDQREAKP